MSRWRQLSESEREERRQRDRERLEAAARELQSSEGWTRWVKVRRTNGLARYSVNNTLLIAMQATMKGIDPIFVCGYRRWSELGYQVRKGEKAIAILGPIRRWVEDEDTGTRVQRVVGFKALPVFDVAQVVPGEDPTPVAPPPAEPLTGSSHAALREPLLALAAEIDSEVSFEEIAGGAGGWFRPKDRKIAVQPSGHANREIRTLLHELGHALVAIELAANEELPKLSYADEECIVETASHIAASSAGLDTSGEAINYVAGWGENDKLAVVTAAAGLIDKIARRLEETIAVHAEETEEVKEQASA